ncbi:hypothetical protein J3R82DRAFT_1521 [Butyriboletus roseoflavus]|nr:hypothetical protein J3R82DRAFT_1521 [Butyriboletus roseoflavus]
MVHKTTFFETDLPVRIRIMIIDSIVHDFGESDPDSNIPFSSTNLVLASMDPIAPIENLVTRWNGRRLPVISCLRMSRSFLERLYGEASQCAFPIFESSTADNLNAGDVISLVRSRETIATLVSLMGGHDDDDFTALAELLVQGRGPPIDVERATWLSEHVKTLILLGHRRKGWIAVYMGWIHQEVDGVTLGGASEVHIDQL